MKQRWRGAALALALVTGAGLAGITTSQAGGDDGSQLYVMRVAIKTDANTDADRLAQSGFDLIEGRADNGDLLVQGDAGTAKSLRKAGYTIRASEPMATKTADGAPASRYYGGYPNVSEQFAHLATVAATFPNLAQVIDYGDSWRKLNGQVGNDLKAICLTNQQPGDCALNPNSVKPRFFLMAQIHAREVVTGELAYRWIDELTTKYGTDADITSLLDSTEVWIVPVANPDGADIVELGGNAPYLQRKNADAVGSTCPFPPTAYAQAGVDMNRNWPFKYGGVGTSTNLCDQTYKGTGASSEPEVSALQTLITQLFNDQRGPNDTDIAPETVSGSMLTIHSYSNFVLLPWSWTNGNAPNNTALRSLAFRYSYFNGYKTGRGGEINYTAAGTTDDWAYGALGIPGFTFEVGPTGGGCSGFTPAYTCVDSTFWPINKAAFLSAAKMARQPYTLSRGPVSRSVALSATSVAQGTPVTLTAVADDNALGNASGSVGRPSTQAINQAQYCVDVAPWAGCTPTNMTASDGSLNSVTENVTASVSTVGLTPGKHIIYVRSRDTSNYYGSYSAVYLTIV